MKQRSIVRSFFPAAGMENRTGDMYVEDLDKRSHKEGCDDGANACDLRDPEDPCSR